MLRKIERIAQFFKFEEVNEVLRKIAVEGVAVSGAKGCGKQREHRELPRDCYPKSS
ncbi:unnamed protein product [marine sediment metagenome]|uniref:Nitrogen regulatory protein P-II n=1 Tax=marine sediment metagenome TaxID=412755 RepID=X1MU41_9ZZZZ